MNADIQNIRELAERRAQEDSLIARLPELEVQERNQARLLKAQADKVKAESDLTDELTDITQAKKQSDARLIDLMTQLNREVQQQQHLAQWANRIRNDANGPVNRLAWATFFIEKPDYDNRIPEHRVEAEFRISQLKGQLLIDRGSSNLMVLPELPTVAGELVDVILYLTGNAVKR